MTGRWQAVFCSRCRIRSSACFASFETAQLCNLLPDRASANESRALPAAQRFIRRCSEVSRVAQSVLHRWNWMDASAHDATAVSWP
jgi:hypothetical protein